VIRYAAAADNVTIYDVDNAVGSAWWGWNDGEWSLCCQHCLHKFFHGGLFWAGALTMSLCIMMSCTITRMS